ncbi:MAG: hypothetical protein AAF288_07275 [Planctomycetota bacterium]
MLKWFRTNNKIILAVGMSLLMVAFLIQPVLSLFLPNPLDQVVYETPDGEMRVQQLRTAEVELRLLRALGLGPLVGQEEARWMLATKAAEDAGLYAGPAALGLLKTQLRASPLMLGRLAADLRVTGDFIDAALSKYLAVEQYLALAEGAAFLNEPTFDAPAGVRQFQAIQVGFNLRNVRRLSPAAMRDLFQRQYSTVDGAVALIPASAMPLAEAPDDALLQELFNDYRAVAPGESEPYGFGYLRPARVKYEALVLRVDDVARALRSTIRQHEVDAFVDAADLDNPVDPGDVAVQVILLESPASDGVRISPEARRKLVERIASERAPDLAREMIRSALAELDDDTRRAQRTADGYRALDGFEAISLDVVAERVADRFVDRFGGAARVAPSHIDATAEWTETNDLTADRELAGARLTADPRVSLADYVASVREMQGAGPFSPILRRSQVGVASPAMARVDDAGAAQAFLLVRLTAAEPARAPESVEEVDDEIQADARTLLRYRALTADADAWRQRAAEQGLDAVVEVAGAGAELALLDGPARQSEVTLGSEPRPTDLPLVGPNAELLDKVFAQAQTLGSGAADAPLSDRLVAHPVPTLRALVLFRIDAYDPLTQSTFDTLRRVGRDQLVAGILLEPRLPIEAYPFSLENLEQRLGAVPADDG